MRPLVGTCHVINLKWPHNFPGVTNLCFWINSGLNAKTIIGIKNIIDSANEPGCCAVTYFMGKSNKNKKVIKAVRLIQYLSLTV